MPTKINFTVPAGWHELADSELRFIFGLMAADFNSDAIKTLCLLRWNRCKVLSRQSDGTALLRMGDDCFEVRPAQMAELLPALAWLSELPPVPVRPSRLRRARAIAADFQGVPLETYIIADNLYQGFLATRQDALLDELAALLYGKRVRTSPADRIAVFYWVASLKGFFARRYPDFFQPAGADGNLLGSPAPSVEDAMNSMIRALTKGDVTKEREILALDTWRALTELNAMAREYREINSKAKS